MRMSFNIVSVLAVLIVAFASQPSRAALTQTVALTVDEGVIVSLDGDRDDPGTVNSGSLGGSEVIARERATLSEEALRIVSFMKFDLSGLDPDNVVSASFDATFAARLNTINDMAVKIGRVEDNVTDGDTWDDSLGVGTVPLFEWAATSATQSTLVSNVRTETLNTSHSVDLTAVVKDWLNGVNANNGIVMFGDPAVFQGAGFDDVVLNVVVAVPEPASALLLPLGLAALGFRRR